MRIMTRIGLAAASIAALVLIWTAAVPSSAHKSAPADPVNCNLASVGGSYAYAGFGSLSAGNALGQPAGPYNTAAKLDLDGKGHYTVDAVTSYSGVIGPEQFAGNYIVDPGCKVTFYVPFGPGGSDLPAVVAYFTGNHRETRGLSVLPGTNVSYLTVAQ